jgi:hypothetical protein
MTDLLAINDNVITKMIKRWIILYYTQIQQEREGVPLSFK